MNKETYVVCQSCAWQLENNQQRDWIENPCRRCNNTRRVRNPEEILCNLCGECMCPIGTMNEQIPHGLHKATVSGGYDSEELLDGHLYTFSICEACLRRMFIVAKIKPIVSDYIASQESSWEEDQEYYEYKMWRKSGGFHQAYLNKKCNMVKDCPNKAEYTQLVSDEFTETASCEEHKDRNAGCINCKMVPFIPNVLKPFL